MDRRSRLTNELNTTADGFVSTAGGCSPAQWAWKAAPDRWSVAETAEHVTLVMRNVHLLATTKLLHLPLEPSAEERITDDQVVKLLFDRSRRLRAPEAVIPRGEWGTWDEVLSQFTTAREGLVGWLGRYADRLREFGAPHPRLGVLDGAQWILFLAAHTERHTRQISEIRQTAGFPT